MRAIDVILQLSYRPLDGAALREITVDEQGVARPADAARELGLVVHRRQGKALDLRRIELCPQTDVEVKAIVACLCDVGLPQADALFMNGYNSWTDSVERRPDERMRGLSGVPRAVVRRWVLDNSGDYRFVEEDARPGHQHGFGYCYLRRGAEVLLVGSLDENSGFTLLSEQLEDDALVLEKEPPAKALVAGKRMELFSFALLEGTLDACVGRWLELSGIKARPCRPLVGYSSWYRHYGDISDAKLTADLWGVQDQLLCRDLGNCQPIFQIDDGYAKVGDWTCPDPAAFPVGLSHFALECERAGLLPGLWLAPFVVEKQSAVAAEHPEWLLRDEAGQLVAAGGNWSGAWALDTRLGEVREHIAAFMGTVTREWGFRFLKLDFLYAACLLPHDGLNRGQLMADALGLLRASVPEDTWFDLCGVPLMSALGQTEFCRVGCDVGLDWDDVPYMRLLHRERVSTKRSLANTRGRAHLDGRAFRCDPDVFFLRRDVKLTDEQRKALLKADATLGGMFLTSDDFSAWDEGQREAFEASLATFVARAR